MSRSIAAAINLKKQQRKTTLHVLFFFSFTGPVSSSDIYGNLLLSLLLLKTTAIKKLYYSRVFAFIRVELRALLISGPPLRMRKG